MDHQRSTAPQASKPVDRLRRKINEGPKSGADLEHQLAHIHAEGLAQSPYLDRADFSRFHQSDLRLLFALYDQICFEGALSEALAEAPLDFRISRKMRKAAGKTTAQALRPGSGGWRRFELAVSSVLVLEGFRPGVKLVGRCCDDRLQLLQRVVEHEIVHLVEMLLWLNSSCSSRRFQTIAKRFFRHTEFRHSLTTASERTLTAQGLRVGDRVRFQFNGVTHEGFILRIARRATVLVNFASQHYGKYYVPPHLLEPVAKN